MYGAIEMHFNAHHTTFNSLIHTNNVPILATVHLLVSRTAGLLDQKVELSMVTGSYSNKQ